MRGCPGAERIGAIAGPRIAGDAATLGGAEPRHSIISLKISRLSACGPRPDDTDLLSLYGRVIWEARQEKERAAGYFERVVQSAPDD
ncbi:hypothetical protein EJB05_12596, partial [Eragrostis curvula]